jgi:hypothetical protein
MVRVHTEGSSIDTVLAVYVGTSVTNLTLIASDDDSGEGTTSRLVFPARAGVNYKIAVDGYNGAQGGIRLDLTQVAGSTLAVFDDPAFVDTSDNSGAESDTMQTALNSLRFPVLTFTNFPQVSGKFARHPHPGTGERQSRHGAVHNQPDRDAKLRALGRHAHRAWHLRQRQHSDVDQLPARQCRHRKLHHEHHRLRQNGCGQWNGVRRQSVYPSRGRMARERSPPLRCRSARRIIMSTALTPPSLYSHTVQVRSFISAGIGSTTNPAVDADVAWLQVLASAASFSSQMAPDNSQQQFRESKVDRTH